MIWEDIVIKQWRPAIEICQFDVQTQKYNLGAPPPAVIATFTVLRDTEDLIHHPSPGFRTALIYAWYINRRRWPTKLLFHLWLARAYQTAGVNKESFVIAACDSVQIGLNILGLQKETNTTSSGTLALHMRTATAQRKLQLLKFRDPPGRLYEGIACARQQS